MKIGDGSIVALFDKTPPVKGPNDVHCPHFWELKYANGCHYDCQWCLDGATLILRPDLSWRRLDTLQVGDLVMGFGKFGSTMKFAATPIQAIKKVIKPRLELITDRTKTISSYDHKFLSEGRWIKAKYLGTSNFGINFLTRPSNRTPENAAYMAGYLHGISDGDGSMGIYGKEQKVYKYRLAMQDSDAIDRAYKYFKVFGIEMNRFEHNAGSGTILDAIRKDGRFNHSKIIELFNAYKESIDYHAGYAAGIFDAEGCLSSMRISNTNPDILKRIRSSLSSLRVPHKEETYENHCSTIRIVGGIQEHLRFFNIANPAIARKWPGNFTARFDRTSPVITANRLGPGELIDIQTGTENFIANGLASHNCYLNGTFRHKPTGKEPTRKDRDKLSKDLEQALTTLPPTIFNAGEVSDALVYEDDLESVVLPLFEKHKDKGHKILLLTKSNSTRLLRWGHMKDSIIMAYSINSRSVAQVWERAPDPAYRLEAAKEFHDRGFAVRLRLDPMVPIENWENGYREILQTIKDLVPNAGVLTLGSLRGLTSTISWCEKLGKNMDWTNYLTDRSNWGLRIPEGQRVMLYRFVIEETKKLGLRIPIALCKETLGVFEQLGLDHNAQICNCTGGPLTPLGEKLTKEAEAKEIKPRPPLPTPIEKPSKRLERRPRKGGKHAD